MNPTHRTWEEEHISPGFGTIYADGGPGSEIDVTHIQSALGETQIGPPRYVTQVPHDGERMPQSHNALAWTQPPLHPFPSPHLASREKDGAPTRQVIEPRTTRAILVPTRPPLEKTASREKKGARQPAPVSTCAAHSACCVHPGEGGCMIRAKMAWSSLCRVLPYGQDVIVLFELMLYDPADHRALPRPVLCHHADSGKTPDDSPLGLDKSYPPLFQPHRVRAMR